MPQIKMKKRTFNFGKFVLDCTFSERGMDSYTGIKFDTGEEYYEFNGTLENMGEEKFTLVHNNQEVIKRLTSYLRSSGWIKDKAIPLTFWNSIPYTDKGVMDYEKE